MLHNNVCGINGVNNAEITTNHVSQNLTPTTIRSFRSTLRSWTLIVDAVVKVKAHFCCFVLIAPVLALIANVLALIANVNLFGHHNLISCMTKCNRINVEPNFYHLNYI